MAPASSDFSVVRETLRVRNFAIFTVGNGISVLGSWTQRLAVGWLVWHLTSSGAWLGTVAFAEFAPTIAIAPFIGAITDRIDRRKIALIGQYLAMIQATLLAGLTLTDTITPVLLLLLQVFSGMVQPLIQTARLVLVPMLVPRERLGNAIAITSLVFHCARIVGPMLAGVLITVIGVGWAFAINAASYVAVIYALMVLHLPPHQVPAGTGAWNKMGEEAIEGWRHVLGHPLLGWIIPMVTASSVLIWPLGDMMPGIADHVFGRDATGLATLTASQGLGAILGGLFLARRPSPDGLSRVIVNAMIFSGIMVAGFAMMRIFWAAVPLLALSSFFNVMVGVGSQSLAQVAVDDHMRGRSLAVWYTVTRLGPAIGAVLLGSAASAFGFGRPLLVAGLLSSAIAVVMWVRTRRSGYAA